MTAMWDKLIVLLSQTLEIYQALLRLSRRKREVLVAADSQELEQLTKQEEVLIIEAGKLEILRKNLTQELAAAIGLSPDQTALAVLIEHADSQIADSLKATSEKFAKVTAELVELNDLNEKLIKQSLELINYNINVLSQSAAESTYAPKGQTGPAMPARSILDTKA